MKEVLLRAREYIKRGWCQGAHARDAFGNSVLITSPECRFVCLEGALYLGCCDESEPYSETKLQVQKLFDMGHIGTWNDAPGRTQEEVLTLLDDTIRNLS